MLTHIKEIMPISFKSKQTLDKERAFTLLPADDYELVITDTKKDIRAKYMKPDEEEEVVNFTMEIVGLRDGIPAKDIEGKDATSRKIFFTGRTGSLGFQQDGTPAKMRCLVAYALGLEVNEDFDLEDWEDLAGKTIFAEIVQYKNSKGNESNKISRFLLPPKKRDVDVKDEDIPVINP